MPSLVPLLETAMARYVDDLARGLPPAEGAALADASADYAREAARVSRTENLAGRSWELAVGYLRSLQSPGAPVEAMARYTAMYQAALDVGHGQQKVVETYQALVAALIGVTGHLNRPVVDAAYGAYREQVQRAWAAADLADIDAPALVAAAQSLLAAGGLHGLVLAAVDPAPPGAAAP